MSTSDDLAPLLEPVADPTAVTYSQGTLISWNPATLANTVRVNGVRIDDLAVLGPAVADLTAGDVLAIIRVRGQYLILGRIATTA